MIDIDAISLYRLDAKIYGVWEEYGTYAAMEDAIEAKIMEEAEEGTPYREWRIVEFRTVYESKD